MSWVQFLGLNENEFKWKEEEEINGTTQSKYHEVNLSIRWARLTLNQVIMDRIISGLGHF